MYKCPFGPWEMLPPREFQTRVSVFTQAAFKHVASICKRTSLEFKKQFLFHAQSITEKACSETEQVLPLLTNYIQTCTRDTESTTRARVCEDTLKTNM